VGPRRIDRLLIVSAVVHYEWKGRLYAYGPYAREIDVWAEFFPEVVIAAPRRHEAPPGAATAFRRPNIRVAPQREAGGDTWRAKVRQALLLPGMAWSLGRAMAQADAVHVRCPGNLGAIGACLAPMFSRYRIAKYAGQWPDYPGETAAARFQKRTLRSRWWGAPVTVYGAWRGESSHVVPFFTSMLTAEQMARARRATHDRRFDEPTLRLLYVGAIGAWKNVDSVIRAVASVIARGVAVTCDVVGDGPARIELQRLAASLGVADAVRFAGGVEPDRVAEYYERSHVLVLVSNSEGWPKAIAEAMAFGLICIGSNRGLIPQMLGDERGFVVAPADDRALSNTILTIARSPDRFAAVRARAAEWGQRHTLDDLRAALADLLTRAWDITIPTRPAGVAVCGARP
jgi:glycosyltransferase involved in cell wall biosynthesis